MSFSSPGTPRQNQPERSNGRGRNPHSSRTSASGSRTSSPSNAPAESSARAQTIIQELREKDISTSVPAPEHTSARKMGSDEVEALLVQFVSEKLAHAHLSAQIDNPTRQSVETMAKAWEEPALTIIEAVRRVDREDPPTSFWEMQA